MVVESARSSSCVLFVGCSSIVVAGSVNSEASFVLKGSGFPASSQDRLYWLDNNRVIFTGYEINLDKVDKAREIWA